MIKSGETILVTIEKPAAGGRMIARVDGQVVLVSGAIPGERVLARVERVGKGVAYAETTVVESASSDRRPSAVDLACGGCLYAHIAYARQLAIKSLVIADAFARIGRLTLPGPVTVAASPEDGYRMRARLHMRGAQIGFFREGTHDICDVRLTRQLLTATVDTLERLGAALRPLGPDALRGIELAENADASHRVVALDERTPIEAQILNALAATEGLTGLSSNAGTRGTPYVTDVIALNDEVRVSLRRHVSAFFQGNRFLLRDLAAHVSAQVPQAGGVLDLYAGAGLFALSAAAMQRVRVTAVEGDRVAATDLIANCVAAGDAVVPVHESVERFVRDSVRSVRTVIVDPPRTGMSREAIDGVLRLQADRLVYVSCDVATLARDARRIVDAGYEIERADAFDLFPNTPHVETVVVFGKESKDRRS
jgi:23S rRNA (uracil1939-C5)-methyltransferase